MMALAEARAAWQRTANRCLVQEDAKRAPKLACCTPSLPPSTKQADDTGPTSPPGGHDIPTTTNPWAPFNRNSSHSNLLSTSARWWLQLKPDYGYQKGCLTGEGNVENPQMQESMDDSGLTDQTAYSGSSCENQYTTFDKKDFSSKNANDDLFFDSDRNSPWWRTADTEELALLVAQRSIDLVENCDLPRPQSTRVKKDPNDKMCGFGHDEVFALSLDSNLESESQHHHLSACAFVPGGVSARSSSRKLRMTAEGDMFSGADKTLRDDPNHEKFPETHVHEDEASKAKLMEALRHSQTRAREAEKVAKQACAEKEYVMKLVFRQASELFAYRQWIHILQLENMCFQSTNSNKASSLSAVKPVILPQRSKKTRTSWQKSSSRKRGKRCRPWYDVGDYAVVFALGLGLIGAGLLLGWTIGWMLPIW